MDVIANRHLLGKLRDIVRWIPFAWTGYHFFWRVRHWLEARRLYPLRQSVHVFGSYDAPTLTRPVSQLCTAAQMLSPTYFDWCKAFHSPPRFSRKQWEFVYILEVLKQAGMLVPGKAGIGFGCGREPLVGLMAAHGCRVVATDLDFDAAHEKGWVDTAQHVAGIAGLFERAKEYISKQAFDERVEFQVVDMNAIPPEHHGRFDFTWSACSLEHLGSLRHGMEFVKNSVRCLKPGGVAVHTTEFNLSSVDDTFEAPNCSIYRESDIRQLIAELQAEGFEVEPLNLNTGDAPVDNYVDFPPYQMSPHLKLQLEGYVVTSIGLIIRAPAL